MRIKGTQIQFNPLSFDYIIKPISIVATGFSKGVYRLEFQKGPQQVKTFEQKIKIQNSKEYLLQGNEEIHLKLPNPKHSAYSWSLYKNTDENTEYIDSAKLNLHDYYQRYTQDIRQNAAEYNKILSDLSIGAPIKNNWKNMKGHLNYLFVKQVANESGKFKVEFTLEIRSELDYIADKQIFKSKISVKGSFESDVKSNSSSKNQLKIAKIKTLEKMEEKSEQSKQAKTKVKFDTIIPEEIVVNVVNTRTSQLEEAISSITSPPNNINPDLAPQQVVITPFFAAVKTNFQKKDNLSDIPEKSYEESMNPVANEENIDYRSVEIKQLPQDKLKDKNYLFSKKRTLNIEIEELQSEEKKRRNTQQLPHKSLDLMNQNLLEPKNQDINQPQGIQILSKPQQQNNFQNTPEQNFDNHDKLLFPQKQKKKQNKLQESPTKQNRDSMPSEIATKFDQQTVKSQSAVINKKSLAVLIAIVFLCISCFGISMYHSQGFLKNNDFKRSKNKISKDKSRNIKSRE